MANLFQALFRKRAHTSDGEDEEPIRAELYSIERLELFAAALSIEQKVSA